jgi:hypothetical protein
VPTNFLEAAANSGYLSPAVVSGTGNTHTTTTVDTLSFNPQTTGRSAGSLLKGQFVTLGGGGHSPDIVASVASSTSITILAATSSTLTGTAVNIYNYPVLIGGEASALTNGSAVTSSYWNNTGIFRGGSTPSDIDFGIQGDIWFMSGGAFTPSAGGVLAGWFLPSRDGGTNFETIIATPSSTVPAVSRSPDFIIPLDNAAYAAGNVRYGQGRFIAPLPTVPFKVELQNNSGVTMPSTWAVFLAPWAIQY